MDKSGKKMVLGGQSMKALRNAETCGGSHLQSEQMHEIWEICRSNWISVCGHETITLLGQLRYGRKDISHHQNALMRR